MHLKQEISFTTLKRVLQRDELQCFLEIFTDEFWDVFEVSQSFCNCNDTKKLVNRNLCKMIDAKKSLKLTTRYELSHFFGILFNSIYYIGIMLLLGNTYANNVHNLRDHYKSLVTTYGVFPKLGINRFELLRRASKPNLREITQITNLLSKNSQK